MIFTYTQSLDCEYNRCWKLSIELVQSIKTTATWVAIAREALLSSIHLQSACPATGTFTHRHTHRHRETQSHTQTTELTRMHGCMTLSADAISRLRYRLKSTTFRTNRAYSNDRTRTETVTMGVSGVWHGSDDYSFIHSLLRHKAAKNIKTAST